jgi:MFS family permease
VTSEREIASMEMRKSFLRRTHQLHVRRRDLIRMRGVKPLLVGQALGQIGDASTSLVAAQLLLFANNQESMRTSLLSSIGLMLPIMLIVGPVAGVIVDRFHRRHILVAGHGSRGVLSLLLVLALSASRLELALVCLAVMLGITRILYSARTASVVHFVRKHELPAIDSLSFILGMASGLAGGAIAACLIDVNWRLALLIAAILQFLASVAFNSIDIRQFSPKVVRTPRSFNALRDQLQASKIKFAIGSTASLRLLLGLTVASVALHVGNRLSLEAVGFASLLALISTGNFMGSITAEWFVERFRRRSIAVLASVSSAAVIAAGQLTRSPMLQLATVAFCAFAFQNLRICTDSSVQANTPDEVLGRVFATYDVIYNVAYAVGIVLGVGMFGSVPVSAVLAVVCFIHISLAVLFVRGTETVSITAAKPPVQQPAVG